MIPRINFQETGEDRYARHHLIGWWNQSKLSNAKAIVVGAGALGNEVLKLLALVGWGHILVVDFDTISRSNLTRTVLFRESDVGRPKVEVAVERIREINPQIDIRGVQGDLRFDVGLGDYREADVVFGCLDSVNARWALNRKCLKAGVAWIDGGISDFHGQVTWFSPSAGACYECTFTEATYERFNRRYSCPYGLLKRQPDREVPTTAVTTSVIAALQVQEALLFLHGREEDALKPGERLTIYLKPYRLTKDRLPENKDCLAHDPIPMDIPMASTPLDDGTVYDAIQHARQEVPEITDLELAFDLVSEFYCEKCETHETVLRPKDKIYQDQAQCPKCKQIRTPVTVSVISIDSELARLSLSALGIPHHEILSFRGGAARYFLQSPV